MHIWNVIDGHTHTCEVDGWELKYSTRRGEAQITIDELGDTSVSFTLDSDDLEVKTHNHEGTFYNYIPTKVLVVALIKMGFVQGTRR